MLEALRPPLTTKFPITVEEACETNPPVNVERLATSKVEEAFNTPLTERLEENVEEAVERRPLFSVNNPLPVTVFRVAALETVNWEVEALPVIAKEVVVALVVVELTITKLVMVEEELLAIIPPLIVAVPLTFKVLVAVIGPKIVR